MSDSKICNTLNIFQRNTSKIFYFINIDNVFFKSYNKVRKGCNSIIHIIFKISFAGKKVFDNNPLIKFITYKTPCHENNWVFGRYLKSLKFCNNNILDNLSFIRNIGYKINNIGKSFRIIIFPIQNKYENYKKKSRNIHMKSNFLYYITNIVENFSIHPPSVFNSYFINTVYEKILNILMAPFPLTLVNHLKLGYSFGHIPFYEGFLMGGPFSVRGYKSGEIGLSKHLLQSSFEVRYLKNPFLECIFLFLDHCSDLNSSEQLIYNPSDYKLCCGQGSSLGVGVFLGNARIEYGFNTTTLKNFMNFDYGERY
mmetsp:Transcript_4710/g.9157  ORF Transcript_4710/g.9157 Transcript_4710/m.9157 type:complete len:311 (-) Transcript_4710:433-1365(-)